MKTNKSFAKRIKVTKSGKFLTRTPGKNHFNAKASRRNQLNKKRMSSMTITNKEKSRYLINV